MEGRGEGCGFFCPLKLPYLIACVQTSPISFAHAEKGRLRNAVANRVPVSCWVSKILGTRCDRLTHSVHCLT